MITGDHAVTAAAIGKQLGIEGKALTGAQFAAMSDADATNDLDNIAIVARVTPRGQDPHWWNSYSVRGTSSR